MRGSYHIIEGMTEKKGNVLRFCPGGQERSQVRSMKVSVQKVLAAILMVLSFPFFTAGVINGKQALVMEKRPDLEKFLAPAAAAEIPQNYPAEAVKAQTVLVRSRCCSALEQGKKREEIIARLAEAAQGLNKQEEKNRITLCEQAVEETEGVVLNYGGKVVTGPFFAVGNGITRSGNDVFGNENFPWLEQVESPWDIDSEEYLSGVFFTPQELRKKLGEYGSFIGDQMTAEEVEKKIEITASDQAGYVMELSLGGTSLGGEAFRILLELPSSCFSVQAVDGKLRFLCKGLGHGVGLSQTGAAAMAEEGKSWMEILQYYFPAVTLEKESIF